MVNSAGYNLVIGSGLQSHVSAAGSVKYGTYDSEAEKAAVIQNAKIKFHKIKQSDKYSVHGDWSDDYAVTEEYEVPKDRMDNIINRYKLITFNMISKSTFSYLKSCYKIDSITANQRYRGEGTKAVQSLLERSLADKDTQGRIVVYSEITDGQTSPAGFFYKLGFRFADKSMNDIMETWAIKKIKTDAPKLTGMMYLPKTAVNRLIMYNVKYM